MADEVVIPQETTQVEAPAPTVSASVEAETIVVESPTVTVDVPMETTLDSTGTESDTTAQMGGSEPIVLEEPRDPGPQIKSEETRKGETPPAETQSPPVVVAASVGMRELLLKAKDAIAFRKRKKLDKVMGIFLKRTSVTNDEVEKLLHVSDATATRYLSILEKEGKIVQTGKTGRGVSYTKI